MRSPTIAIARPAAGTIDGDSASAVPNPNSAGKVRRERPRVPPLARDPGLNWSPRNRATDRPVRLLFYSHDGLGLGHTCRNLAIARAVVAQAPNATILLATGSDDLTRQGMPDRVEILKLPSLRKLANEQYGPRYLGISSGEIRSLRARLLAGAVEIFRPDVLLVDKHPFGAGGELRDALDRLRDHGGRAALGLRDILDDPDTVAAEWSPHGLPERIEDFYDRVLIYGQQDIYDAPAAYGFPESLAARSFFCGYVSGCDGAAKGTASRTTESGPGSALESSIPRPPSTPCVLATVGGGEDGGPLIQVFLDAARGTRWNSIAVTGPQVCPGELTRLQQVAERGGCALHRFVPGLERWFDSTAALVCMGGYNTVAQGLRRGVPMVCVPRCEPRREQLLRAEAFARRQFLTLVRPAELTPQRLRAAVEEALTVARPSLQRRIRSGLRLDGAAQAAEHLLALARPGHLVVPTASLAQP